MYARTKRLGDEGEAVARTWLKRHGYMVVPVSLIENGGAPKLETWLREYTLPDNWVVGKDGPGWVEVKTKSRATYHQNTKRWEHGIQHDHWIAYLGVQNRTRVPASICIIEVETRLFLLAPIGRLIRKSRLYDGHNMPGGKPHVFFPREAFDWYPDSGEGIPLIEAIEATAQRTLVQGSTPVAKQLSLL